MIAIPAIDLREGACVQLVGGSYADERVREADPLAVAQRWHDAGFRSLHIVDLDAATGRGGNLDVIQALLVAWNGDAQVGGGLRDDDSVERVLAAGATRVVLGTRAVEDPAWLASVAARHPGRIVAAVDARDRRVVTRGWDRTLDRDVVDTVRAMAAAPLAGVLVTSVEREGRMAGPDLSLAAELAAAAASPLFASGGIASLEDLRALQHGGVHAAVLGMALYTGAIDARAAAREFCS